MEKTPMIIFWDVDTQYDFIEPEGKLYVNGAEQIKGNLAQLTRLAREYNIPIIGSVDYHDSRDAELSDEPDFRETFPPHCLANTPGAMKIGETAPRNPVWVNSTAMKPNDIDYVLSDLKREIILRKQEFDVFTNPNAIEILRILHPENIFVYGVALDVCVAHAINGMLRADLHSDIHLVEDAVKAIYPQEADKMLQQWEQQGVIRVTTAQVEAMIASHIVV